MHTISENVIKLINPSQRPCNRIGREIATCERIVNKEMCIVPMTQSQYDAVFLFCYRLGPKVFEKSATLRHLKNGCILKALTSWRARCKEQQENKKIAVSQELVEQREEEIEMWLIGQNFNR